MPKMKTKSGAKKRFKPTATGFKRRRANRSHILTKKTTKRLRHLRGQVLVHPSDVRSVARMLPNL